MHFENKTYLIQNFLNGRISDSQLRELFFWLNSEKGNLEYERLFNELWISKDTEALEKIDSSILFSKIEAKIKENHLSTKKHFLIGLRNAAAIFILGLILPVIYYSTNTPSRENRQVVYVKESLSNEKIKKVILPDGSCVSLMSGSTILYPSDFLNDKTRDVELSGEAFFEVAKDSIHPFIVKLGEIGIKVVGTSFNVSNYKDENQINVALKSGKVDLFRGEYRSNDNFVHLVPGKMASFSKNNHEFDIQDVDINKYTSWANGSLIFKDDPLSVIFSRMERWYNIKIITESVAVEEFIFSATIKNENLDQVIELLRFSTPFIFNINRETSGEIKIYVTSK